MCFITVEIKHREFSLLNLQKNLVKYNHEKSFHFPQGEVKKLPGRILGRCQTEGWIYYKVCKVTQREKNLKNKRLFDSQSTFFIVIWKNWKTCRSPLFIAATM